MVFGIDMEFAKVDALQFWLTLGAGAIIVILLSIYLIIFVWVFGASMRKYLKAKLTPGTGIIQLYTNENVSIKLAKVKGGEFTDLETKGAKPIVAQSIASINGTDTLMLWNINPPLPDRYVAFLEQLLSDGVRTIEDLKTLDPLSIIKNKYGDTITVAELIMVNEKLRDRNEIKVSADDILSFSSKYMDEHSKKSVIEKEVTISMKRAGDSKYQTYAFILVAMMIVGGFIMLAWKIRYGGN